ncbi:MAG: hypothetical protein JSW34_03675 [Candidatus Zixiibacteriota bacterium]|nr:MAG: hypothetical protein JSW34_03675 [candidate division Zixibacteria bacterium]
MDELTSNGISAWIEPRLKQVLEGLGRVTIDYRKDPQGPSGFLITTGECGPGCGC